MTTKSVDRKINIYINGKEVENKFKSIADAKRKAWNELIRLNKGSDDYVKKKADFDALNLALKRHKAEIFGVSTTWTKLKANIKGIGLLTASAFGFDSIINYGKKLFNLGVEMDTLGRKAETVFGESLYLVTQAAEENAEAMGLTISQYTDAATAIGDLLIPMGFQREEAANISTQLVNLSGALSEWTGGQIKAAEVSDILAKAVLGEREQLKALGISIQEADVKARLAEKGLDKLTGTMLQQAKAAATLELITEKSVDAQTSFAENSDSLIRKQAELSAKVSEVSEKLATVLIPVFTRLVDFAGVLADAFSDLASLMQGIVDPAQAALEAFEGQNATVQDLETNLVPLIERYEDLSNKSNLSEAEQEELRATIQKISEQVPTAITSFDEYGKALGISADKAREFVEQQQAILKIENKNAIDKQTESLEDLTKQQEALNAALNNFDEEGNLVKTISVSRGQLRSVRQIVKLSNEEIAELQSRLDKVTTEVLGTTGLIKKLSGQPLINANPDAATPVTQSPTLEEIAAQEKRAKALAKQREKQAKADLKAKEKAIKDAEKLEQKRLESIQKLNQKIADEQAKFRLEQLEGEEKIIEETKAKYAKLIAEATELTGADSQEVAALIQVQTEAIDAALTTYRAEQAKKEEERLKKEAEERIKLEEELQKIIQDAKLASIEDEKERELEQIEIKYQEQLEKIKELEAQQIEGSAEARAELESLFEDDQARTLVGFLTDFDTEDSEANLEKLETYYAKLFDLAQQNEIDTTELKATYEEKRLAIAEKFQKKQLKAEDDLDKARINAGKALLGAFKDLAGENEALAKGIFLAEKAIAAAEVIVNLQREIASIRAANAILGAAGIPITAAQVATARINAGISLATIAATTVAQFRKGGYTEVTGEDDGRRYRAEYIGRPSGLLSQGPKLALLNEDGPEYVVPNHALRKPKIARHLRIIDNLINNRPVPQYMAGGLTNDTQGNVPQGEAVSDLDIRTESELNTNLLAAIERLNDNIENGIPAIIGDTTIREMLEKIQFIKDREGIRD